LAAGRADDARPGARYLDMLLNVTTTEDFPLMAKIHAADPAAAGV